jgi:hypothetical protein
MSGVRVPLCPPSLSQKFMVVALGGFSEATYLLRGPLFDQSASSRGRVFIWSPQTSFLSRSAGQLHQQSAIKATSQTRFNSQAAKRHLQAEKGSTPPVEEEI